MLNCHNILTRADALLARELTFREWVLVRLHLLICEHCRRYVRQLRLLTDALRGLRELQGPVDAAAIVEAARRGAMETKPSGSSD